ncbi:MAG: redoxin domain-containing protein [Dysgonamonadaceae bacterium]|jgi:peroxiredoxin|nr:redoxin domain-containing protein [Dysgonamonadaceae bacterium]
MNKRKIIAIVVGVLTIGILAFLFYGISTKSSRKRAIAQELSTIPTFEFHQLCGNTYTQDSLNKQQSAVFIYFHSDCDFCVHKARNIAEHLHNFVDTQLLFVSSESVEMIQLFAENKGLLNQPNVLFLQDRKHIFPMRFDVNSSPHALVYDKNGQLLRRFAGQVLATTIINVLQESEMSK